MTNGSATIQLSRLDRWGALYARIALGAAFLSAVAGRFGLWQRTPGMKCFADFIQYTAQVNSFLPAAVIPSLAWTATVAETTLGILLIVGLWPRWVSLASAILLAMFGTAMAISLESSRPWTIRFSLRQVQPYCWRSVHHGRLVKRLLLTDRRRIIMNSKVAVLGKP